MPQNTLFLNGEFIPANEAKISVFDRGFIFGDGVYEVIPAYGGNLFRLHEHLKRLENSLIKIRIAPPLSNHRWQEILRELVTLNGGGDLSIYVQITRGAAPRDHAFPNDVTPTIMATATPLKPVDDELLSSGASAITLDDIYRFPDRRARSDNVINNHHSAREICSNNRASLTVIFGLLAVVRCRRFTVSTRAQTVRS